MFQGESKYAQAKPQIFLNLQKIVSINKRK